MKNKHLSQLKDLIANSHFASNQKKLEELSADMEIPIVTDGVSFLLYSFDRDYSVNKSKNKLFPFFTTSVGVQVMCDYCLFGFNKGKFYVLLIELKRGQDAVLPQLKAGEVFADFIVKTCNRINKKKLQPVVRYISIRNNKLRKPLTKQGGVVYDTNNLYTFEGYSLYI